MGKGGKRKTAKVKVVDHRHFSTKHQMHAMVAYYSSGDRRNPIPNCALNAVSNALQVSITTDFVDKSITFVNKCAAKANRAQPEHHRPANGTMGIAGDCTLSVVQRMLYMLKYNWRRVVVGLEYIFSKDQLPDLMRVLSNDKIYIIFGWNGEEEDGVNKSHFVALRFGILISDLAAGVNNDPATNNFKAKSVKNLTDIFYEEHTCVKAYEVVKFNISE